MRKGSKRVASTKRSATVSTQPSTSAAKPQPEISSTAPRLSIGCLPGSTSTRVAVLRCRNTSTTRHGPSSGMRHAMATLASMIARTLKPASRAMPSSMASCSLPTSLGAAATTAAALRSPSRVRMAFSCRYTRSAWFATPLAAGATGSAFMRCQNWFCDWRGCSRDWPSAG